MSGIESGNWARPLTTQAAIVAELNAQFVLRDVVLSAPQADEVIVQLEASGMCHADLLARSGGLPFPLPGVMGHEGVGRIVEIGAAVSEVAVGDRVVISFSWCGHCQACLRAAPVYCDDWPRLNLFGGSRADGSATLTCDDAPLHGHFFGQSSFSRFIVTTARATVKVPDDLPASILAPLGCGIQTGVSAATAVLRPKPGDRVVVFGAGAVGLSAIMGLGLTGVAQIIAVDIHPARLELARILGATDTVNARTGDVAEQIAKLTGGAGVEGTIETSGNVGALGNAVTALASAGTCVVVGVPNATDTLAVNITGLVARGIRLVGTNQGNVVPRVFIPKLIELHRRGRLPIEKLVTDFAFVDINQAVEASLNGSVIKPVLHMD
jgi:aryl-alcohol dehydrogenase